MAKVKCEHDYKLSFTGDIGDTIERNLMCSKCHNWTKEIEHKKPPESNIAILGRQHNPGSNQTNW